MQSDLSSATAPHSEASLQCLVKLSLGVMVQSLAKLKLDEESAAILQNNTITESMLSVGDTPPKKFLTDAIRKLDPLVQNVSAASSCPSSPHCIRAY